MSTTAVPPYVPTRALIGAVNLSGNESPLPPLPIAQRAMAAALAAANRYPDPTCTALTDALALDLRVPAEQIVVGPGSSTLLRRLFAAARTGPDDEILAPHPGFQAFPLLAAQADIALRDVELSPEWTVDLDAMADAIDPGSTRLVLVSNPHNPTGTVHRVAALRRFLDLVPEDVCVVLDEAYVEYANFGDSGAFDGVALAREHWAAGRTNLAVTRTFSKAHALAAERVGYLVAPPELAATVAAAAVPFEVTGPAQAGALASLGAVEAIRQRCDRLATERVRLSGHLRSLGFAVPPSAANHVWLPLGAESEAFERHCLTFGCTVLTYPGLGVRVTVGRPPDDDLFLAAARAWSSAS